MERDYLELINSAYSNIVAGDKEEYHLYTIDGKIDIYKSAVDEIKITIKRKSIENEGIIPCP